MKGVRGEALAGEPEQLAGFSSQVGLAGGWDYMTSDLGLPLSEC